MSTEYLEQALNTLTEDARNLGYKIETPTLFIDNVYGNKLAYYQHGHNRIVVHDHYAENGTEEEVLNTLVHEVAHAVAEQNNETDKRIWHGDFWKKINAELGGDAERYHQGGYRKPAPVKKSMQELFAIQPKYPADRWERGTFKQWLSRGYHVMKGQKGTLTIWEFVADEYELEQDGKTSNYGRASAVYFTPDQVEANKPKGVK